MSKKGWLVWGVLLSAGTLLSGCSDDQGGVGPGAESTLSGITVPFTVGNRWIYATETDTAGVKTTTADTTRVVGTETSGGVTYYVLENATPEGTQRALIRQTGQKIFTTVNSEKAGKQDPFQEWMAQITTASLPWKIADLGARSGTRWVELDATSPFNLGGANVTVPAGDCADAYHGEFTTRLTIIDPSGVMSSVMVSRIQYWIADGVGFVKEVNEGSVEMAGGGYSVTKTSGLSSYTLR